MSVMNDTDIVLTEIRDRSAVITLNRPARLNAIDVPMLLALERAIDACEADEKVRVIIITGAGDKAFMAGGDIAGLNSRQGLAHYVEFSDLVHRVFRRVEMSDKPTICAVNGYALGGGMELMLATDIRILADTARIGLTEITLGIFPGRRRHAARAAPDGAVRRQGADVHRRPHQRRRGGEARPRQPGRAEGRSDAPRPWRWRRASPRSRRWR